MPVEDSDCSYQWETEAYGIVLQLPAAIVLEFCANFVFGKGYSQVVRATSAELFVKVGMPVAGFMVAAIPAAFALVANAGFLSKVLLFIAALYAVYLIICVRRNRLCSTQYKKAQRRVVTPNFTVHFLPLGSEFTIVKIEGNTDSAFGPMSFASFTEEFYRFEVLEEKQNLLYVSLPASKNLMRKLNVPRKSTTPSPYWTGAPLINLSITRMGVITAVPHEAYLEQNLV